MLEKASLSVLSIRAAMTSSEKAAAITKFNNANANIDVLVANQRCGSAGLNLHHCCHYGIQVQYPWNFGTAAQSLGRLIRVGQKEEVTWVVLRVNDTAYDHMEHKACVKEAQQLATEFDFQDWVAEHPKLRTLLAYEVLRVTWSQPFNRYIWEVFQPKSIQDFNSGLTRTYARFYGMLAKLLMSSPDGPPPDFVQGGYSIDKLVEFLDVLPVAWERAMLKGKAPADQAVLRWEEIATFLSRTEMDGAKAKWVKEVRHQQAEVYYGSARKRKTLRKLMDDTPSKRVKYKPADTVDPADDLSDTHDDPEDAQLAPPPLVRMRTSSCPLLPLRMTSSCPLFPFPFG